MHHNAVLFPVSIFECPHVFRSYHTYITIIQISSTLICYEGIGESKESLCWKTGYEQFIQYNVQELRFFPHNVYIEINKLNLNHWCVVK
jgi:hypothetical protein